MSSDRIRRSAALTFVLASALGCDSLDNLGTQTSPGRLRAGEPESVRIAAPADGFEVDEPFVIRIDRLAYQADDDAYDAERVRCVTVQVTSTTGALADPYDGFPVTQLDLALDRGESMYLTASSDTDATMRVRATVLDAPDCTAIDETVPVIASRERSIYPAF